MNHPRTLHRLALIAVVTTSFAVTACGDKPTKKATESTPTEKTGAPESGAPASDADTYQSLAAKAKASDSAADWFALGAWCEKTGFKSEEKLAQRIYKRVIKIDPNHAEARAKLGYTRYTGPIKRFAKLGWLRADELAMAKRAEKERAASASGDLDDPWFAAADEIVEELKADKHLAKFDLVFGRYPPFVIAKERGNRSTDQFKLRTLGEMLQAGAKHFRDTFKGLDLKPLEGVSHEGKLSVLPVIFFEEKYTFEKYHLDMGVEIPQGAAAYFMPANNRIVYYEGIAESERFAINKMVHELVHQLIWFYTPKRTRCQLHWFQEGIAEFFSGTERKAITNEDGSRSYEYSFQHKLRERMKGLKNAAYDHWFPFEELVRIPTKSALDRLCRKKVGSSDSDSGRAAAGALFYAEAWSLFWFLWNEEGGKYRPALFRYVEMELNGETGLSHFRRAFEDHDIDEIGQKWTDFVNASGKFLKDV